MKEAKKPGEGKEIGKGHPEGKRGSLKKKGIRERGRPVKGGGEKYGEKKN